MEISMTTLIVTEKPSAAQRIAEALTNSKPKEVKEDETSYYVIELDKEKIIVVAAVGHLYALTQKGRGWNYPVFDIGWEEAHKVRRTSKFSKKYLEKIKALAKDVDSIIGATDLDIEGEVILLNILRYSCGVEDAERMRFSTLTKTDIIEACITKE